MSTPPVPTGIGYPDDWPFWELVYSDPEFVSWDLRDLAAAGGDPSPAAGAGSTPADGVPGGPA